VERAERGEGGDTIIFPEAKMIADSEKPDSKYKAFVRASKRLQQLAIIGVWEDRAWVVGQAGQART
jgi:hypothetical protein